MPATRVLILRSLFWQERRFCGQHLFEIPRCLTNIADFSLFVTRMQLGVMFELLPAFFVMSSLWALLFSKLGSLSLRTVCLLGLKMADNHV